MESNRLSSAGKASGQVNNVLSGLQALFGNPNPVPMSESLKERLRDRLRKNEGVLDQPYKDSKGLLTAGVGINVSTESDFAALPFEKQNPQTKEWEPATEAEKRTEFKRLNGMTRGAILEDETRFRLDKNTINANLDQQIATRERAVQGEFGASDWNKLTDGQKMVLMDVHYARGSLRDFGNLTQAMRINDVEAMVRESSFSGGTLPSGHKIYNFDRVRRNFADIMGIDPDSEEAYKYVALKHGGHPSLRDPKYKKYELPDQSGAEQEIKKLISEVSQRRAFEERTLPQLHPEQPILSTDGDFRAYLNTESLGKTGPSGADFLQFQPSESSTSPVEPDPITDPRVEAMSEMMRRPVSSPGLAALLKPVETLTEAEMNDMITSAQSDYRGWKSGDPLKAHTYEKVQDWHVAMYGDGPQQYDGGKAIPAAPIRPIPDKPTSPVTPDGRDLWQVLGGLGRTVAQVATADGFETAIQGLQQGLNLLNQNNPLPQRSPAYGPYTKLDPVKVDGVYGPRTDFAVKQATARLGPEKVKEGLALGRFSNFARTAQKNRTSDGLDTAVGAAFGHLFRDPGDNQSPKLENGVLQDTLNALGSRTRDDWQPLKLDNWIGPKTTAAFGQVLEKDDADSLTTAFGRGLGLLS